MTEVGLGEKEGGGACQEDSSAAEDSILRMGRAAGSSYTRTAKHDPCPRGLGMQNRDTGTPTERGLQEDRGQLVTSFT